MGKKATPRYVAESFTPLCCIYKDFGGICATLSGGNPPRYKTNHTLTRHGYHITDLVQQFDAKPTEIKALFSNQLDPTRTAALRDRMLRAGLPL